MLRTSERKKNRQRRYDWSKRFSEMRRKENRLRSQDKTDELKGRRIRVMKLRFPLVHWSESSMQKELSGGTSVIQLAAERLQRIRQGPAHGDSIGALIISVSVYLLHGGRQILFDAVQWSWFPGIMMHVWDVQQCDSLDIHSWMRSGVARKKSGSLTFPQ